MIYRLCVFTSAVLLSLALGAAPAQAASFEVRSTADGVGDDSPGDGFCFDVNAQGDCTLRAAIAETNALAGTDTITFSAAFDGGAEDVITVGSALPAITGTVNIVGDACTRTPAGPCVGLSDGTGLVVNGIRFAAGGGGSSITGVNFRRFAIGIRASAPSLIVRRNWFGTDMAGTQRTSQVDVGIDVRAAADGVGAEADGASIGWAPADGGTGTAGRNVFAGFDTAAIRIFGADNTSVRGNWVGMLPDGSVAPLGAYDETNDHGVQIGSVPAQPGPANVANGTLIGDADQNTTQTAACDGPCNVFAAISSNPVDLSAADFPYGAAPAGATTVRGNYVGLAPDGTDGRNTVNLSSKAGIEVGNATPVMIGGTTDKDRNYIGGNPDGIATGPAVQGLTIQKNWIGAQPDGTGSVHNAISAVSVSGDLGGGQPSVQVLQNVIAGGDSAPIGVAVSGRDTLVQGNKIGADGSDSPSGFGSASFPTLSTPVLVASNATDTTVRNNTIGHGDIAGLIWEGLRGTIAGNFIGQVGSTIVSSPTGILARQGGSTSTNRNVAIGGVTGADANRIHNQTGAAITVDRVEGVKFLDNAGFGNRGQFYELKDPDGKGNAAGPTGAAGTGAADGLGAPGITGYSPTQAIGVAQPNATITLYRQAPPQFNGPEGISGFYGTTTANGSGAWTKTFDTPLGEGHRVFAIQTVNNASVSGENSSELSNVAINDNVPPATPTITGGPSGPTNQATPTFTFTGIESPGRAQCAVASGMSEPPIQNFVPCNNGSHTASPALAEGQYTFHVYGIDEANNQSLAAATRTFTVDTTAPTVDCCPGSGPSGPTNNTMPTFAWTASGDDSALRRCSLDQGTASFGPCSTPTQFNQTTPLAEGSYTFRIQVSDPAGNMVTDTQSFTVDTVPPTVDCCQVGPNGPTRDRRPSFTWTSAPENARECSLDRGAPAYGPCSTPGQFNQTSDLADGTYTFRIRVTDPAGNTATDTQSFTVDATGPAVTITGPKKTTNRKPTLRISSAEQGATFRCKLDSGAEASCGTTFRPARRLKPGRHKLVAVALDALGNRGAAKTFSFRVIRKRR